MPRTVLVVEDNEDLRNLYRMFLGARGMSVRVAANAEDALESLSTQPAQVIVLDLTLPGLSGSDFLRKLKADPAHQGCKFIVSSGRDELERTARELGADAFAVKPVALDDLQKQIEALLPQ